MSRILRQPRGNAMLVGVGGSGKQSTTRMAAFIGQMPCLSIEISQGLRVEGFPGGHQGLHGQDGRRRRTWQCRRFLFTDTQVVEESMLEDINSILNSGEIPNLFPQDELDKICSDMIPVCDALGVPASRDNCVATFVRGVWDKLHICLCMSRSATLSECALSPVSLPGQLLYDRLVPRWCDSVSEVSQLELERWRLHDHQRVHA